MKLINTFFRKIEIELEDDAVVLIVPKAKKIKDENGVVTNVIPGSIEITAEEAESVYAALYGDEDISLISSDGDLILEKADD